MTMLPGIKKYLKQSITRYPHSAFSAYGQSTYGTSNTITCLIQRKLVNTLDMMGNESMSSTQIFIDGDETISAKDKIVLPDGSAPKIINIKEVVDFTGTINHKVIYT